MQLPARHCFVMCAQYATRGGFPASFKAEARSLLLCYQRLRNPELFKAALLARAQREAAMPRGSSPGSCAIQSAESLLNSFRCALTL